MSSIADVVKSKDPAKLREWLEKLPDINGSDPIDYIAERPVHKVLAAALRLGCSENEEDRAAYMPMVDVLFSHPGLNLKVRFIPTVGAGNGYLQQNIVVTGLPNNLMRDVLKLLAQKRGLPLKDLLDETAPTGGAKTKSCLYIVADQATFSKDMRKVGLLLELGATVDEDVKKLVGGNSDPYDEMEAVRKKCGGKVNAGKIRSMIEAREADPAGWKYVDDDPAGQDAPQIKRRKTGPRQFYK